MSVRAALLLAALSACAVARAADEPAVETEPEGAEVVWELDAYYTSAGLHLPLTDEPVPDGGQMSEREVYQRLFLDSFTPRLLLLEASVYPMPVLGTWIRKHEPGFYDDFAVGDVKVVETATAGFQEPWALSAFIGSEMEFTRPGKQRRGTNKGYMGYLVSYGKKHIKENRLIDDDWWEFEWKLKGERDFDDEHLSWSFRVGTRAHRNEEIADLVYLGARRSDVNFAGKFLSFLENSNLDLKWEFTRHGTRFVRQDLVFGKNYPIKRWGMTLSLDMGVIYEKNEKYDGALRDSDADTLILVLRPNFAF
jgi:hypothetical protein